LAQVGRSHEQLLSGYDAIAHLKIVPKHLYSAESNEIRMTSYPPAKAADKKLYEETFHSHPKVVLCDNRGGLKSKINKVCKLVRHHLSHKEVPEPSPSATSDGAGDAQAVQALLALPWLLTKICDTPRARKNDAQPPVKTMLCCPGTFTCRMQHIQ
jgi:hypothetical protein